MIKLIREYFKTGIEANKLSISNGLKYAIHLDNSISWQQYNVACENERLKHHVEYYANKKRTPKDEKEYQIALEYQRIAKENSL